MALEALTNIPPKRVAIIVGVGVVGGLAWRHFHKSTTPTTGGAAVDTSQLALAANSAGNLGAGGTVPVPSTNDATRDFGSAFPLPVTKGVITGADGIDYYVTPDGQIIGPVPGQIAPPAAALPGVSQPISVSQPVLQQQVQDLSANFIGTGNHAGLIWQASNRHWIPDNVQNRIANFGMAQLQQWGIVTPDGQWDYTPEGIPA